MTEPQDAPDLHDPNHRAVSLHLKVFDAYPGWVWNNRDRKWLEKDSLDVKIQLYEDRVRGWFLRWGEELQRLPNGHDAGFVVLMIAISYLEGNEQYRRGESSKNRSGEYFKSALWRVFEWVPDHIANSVYTQARCGLFHDGMTRNDIEIENRFEYALDAKDGKVLISPNKFLDAVKDSFESYLKLLRDTNNETDRRNFERFFDQRVNW